MFGWEFPPYFAGGVGIVCAELSKALAKKGIQITYVMPSGSEDVIKPDFLKLIIANNRFPFTNISIKKIPSLLKPYISSPADYKKEYEMGWKKSNAMSNKLYGEDLFREIYLFAEKARLIAMFEDFDVIHAHDYTTFPAAIAAKEATGKPMIVHVHITQFDITGGQGADPGIYQIEKEGMMKADVVIAISNFVKNRLIQSYGIPEHKIAVVHNAAEFSEKKQYEEKPFSKSDKIVLFLGRITLQKGPDYFVEAAKKVLDKEKNVKFVMAGTGDMLPRVIERAAQLGIVQNFIFTGFVSRDEVNRLHKMADVFVMPSVSEPFGIVPLEAMYQGTPVIISKQSGVSEILSHCLKVDFWDTEDMANKILAALKYSSLSKILQKNGLDEVFRMDWSVPADKCISIYNRLIGVRINA